MSRRLPPDFAQTLGGIRDYRLACASLGVRPKKCIKVTTALREAFAFLAEPATLLILSGDFGSGKSFAAAAAWWEIDRQVRAGEHGPSAHRPEWISAPELAMAPRYSSGENLGAADLLRALLRPVLVVVDDAGEESESQESKARMQDLVNRRHERGAKSVITTNLAAGDFVDRFGGRIRSRLRSSGLNEDGSARWWVDCPEEDMRGTVAPEIPAHNEPTREAAILSPDEMKREAGEMLASLEAEMVEEPKGASE